MIHLPSFAQNVTILPLRSLNIRELSFHGIPQAATFNQTPSSVFNTSMLLIVLGIVLALAIACIIIAVILFLPARAKERKVVQSSRHDNATYKAQVRDVETEYTAGDISKQEAYRRLAEIARQFASDRLGIDVTSHTLTDLAQSSQISPALKNSHGLNLLRTTIEALYPPEFAFEATHTRSASTTVIEACGWVDALIERWDD
ncbi:c-type cytochrome biogenesis protein CcmI [Alloscardovia theropitheci]|uniref:C-type cytochrome biogenesis protein CcmI n=1 Tax=Alloscardovia theropitheci TaxID=2496842 RepID=A0A4R0QRA7_9BIFI|nr:c-type cytochrome biogenesis protein CcmI [Alloscardovia theropitheci]TCD54892.1 c-type cytochrome biogenesis protein CcmI [Alloscardovia theropitheci]